MERISRYPLQLDPMDLNYLPLTFSRDFINMAPLWSIGSDTNEYFEFEIREKIDDNIQDSNFTTTTCYVCAIDVPKIFFKDHCGSKRHYINKCIAETALDRMKKHLQNKEDYAIMNNNHHTYFCHECVVTVPQKDQHSHENLQSHKYLSMLDHLLENLYKIYANENKTNSSGSGSKKDKSYNIDISKNDSNTIIACERNENIEKKRRNESVVSTDSFNLNRYSVSELKQFGDNCNSIDTSISETIKSQASFILKNNKPATSGGISESIGKDYSSGNELSDCVVMEGDKFKCTVCYSSFDINALNTHIAGARHKMNMISNVHYMMKQSGNDLYCIVCCNTLENSVISAREHCKEPNHKKEYKRILKENGIKKIKCQMYCELCDKAIPKRNEFVHIFGCKQHHKKKSTVTFCSFCDTFIANNEVNNHENSHKSKLDLKNLNNSFDKTICGVTNVKITENSSSNAAKHIEPYFCVICQVYVPNTAKNIDMHTNGAPHRKKAEQKNQVKDSFTRGCSLKSEPTNEGNTYYCDICKCYISNNSNLILEHSMGASHLKNLKKIKESLVAPKELPSSKPGEKKTEIICKVCKVKLPNTKINISEHGKGKVHLNNYKLTLHSENILLNDNKLFCQPCNVIIENPLKHIEEKSHKNKNKLYIKNTVKPSLTGEFTNPSSSEPVKQTTNELPVIDTLLIQKDLVGNQNLSDLKIQDQPSPDFSQSQIVENSTVFEENKKNLLKTVETDTKTLSSSKEWQKDDKKVLKNEWITVLDGEYYCKICNTFLQNVKQHISDRMHQYLHPKFPY